jgi:hypothetical protein
MIQSGTNLINGHYILLKRKLNGLAKKFSDFFQKVSKLGCSSFIYTLAGKIESLSDRFVLERYYGFNNFGAGHLFSPTILIIARSSN